MARAPRKPTGAPVFNAPAINAPGINAPVPVIPAVAASEDSVASVILPAPISTASPRLPEPIPAASTIATEAAESVAESAAAVIDAAVEASRDAAAAAVALPKAVAAPISDEAAVVAPKVEPAVAKPIAAAAKTATLAPVALAPVRAADAIAANVTAWCESSMALVAGFERFNARLAEMAGANLREGMALQQALLGLGTSDALARRSPAWIGERIGAYASAPGELAMIAFETAEAAARPVVKRAQERLMGERVAGGVAGNIV